MKLNKSMILRAGAGLLMMAGMCGDALAQAVATNTPLLRHLWMDAAYARETKDQAWHLRIAGSMPNPSGIYVIVYNERGDIVYHGAIPSGSCSPEVPFVLTVPADGAAQQYVIKLLGADQNRAGITLPMTDLPFEVYGGWDGGGVFGMPYPKHWGSVIRRVAFQVNPGVQKVTFFGGVQNMRVLDTNGTVVADNRPADGLDKSVKELNLTPQPGRIYWLDPGNAMQFQTPKGAEKIYFTFDPERWFSPSLTWDLDSRPWWKGLFNE